MACMGIALRLNFRNVKARKLLVTNRMPLKYLSKDSIPVSLSPNTRCHQDIHPLSALEETSTFSTYDIRKIASLNELEKFLQSSALSSNEITLVCNHICRNFIFYRKKINFKELKNMVNSDGFQKLFFAIDKYLPMFPPNDLKIIFEICMAADIDRSSILMKKLLKLIIENINKLGAFDVLTIYKGLMLQNKEETYVKHAKLACLEYMMNCFDKYRKPNQPVNTLIYFARDKYTPSFIRERLLSEILELDTSNFQGSSLTQVLAGLSLLQYSSFQKNKLLSLKSFLNGLEKNLDGGWPPEEVVNLTEFYAKALSATNIVYSQSLIDKIAVIATQNMYPLTLVLRIAKAILTISHFSECLLKYICMKAFDDKEVENLHSNQICLLITICGNAGFKIFNQSEWYIYKNEISKMNFENLDYLNYVKIINAAAGLAALGIYDDKLIEKALSFASDDGLLEENKYIWQYFILYQCVVVLHPSYEGKNLSSSEMLKVARYVRANMLFNEWADVIMKAFGGENYVLRNCTTSLQDAFSYVIVLDKSNKPVDISSYHSINKQTLDNKNEPLNVEDIMLDSNQKLLVIIEFPKFAKTDFRNVNILTGRYSLYHKILRARGYNVFFLNQLKFRELSFEEKLHYVKEKFEETTSSL